MEAVKEPTACTLVLVVGCLTLHLILLEGIKMEIMNYLIYKSKDE